jgi:arsenate reductase
MTAFPVTIYHNPNCGTSRNTLAMLEEAGLTPTVVRYLDAGWTKDLLQSLAGDAGLGVRDLLRTRGDLVEELGLLAVGVSDDLILSAMVEHPVLVERPIVRTPKGVVLARPKEKVLAILP